MELTFSMMRILILLNLELKKKTFQSFSLLIGHFTFLP